MRRALPCLLLLGSCIVAEPVEGLPTVRYFESLARTDGGYGWEDEPTSHLTATHAAIKSLRLLNLHPPRAEAAAEFLRTGHPTRGPRKESARHAAEIRAFVLEQIEGLQLLGTDASSFAEEARAWTKPSTYPVTYEKQGYPPFREDVMGLLCREKLGLPTSALAPEFSAYVDSRRRPNGSFNNTPASDGTDGHLLNTLWGLEALRIFGRLSEKKAETVAWLRARPIGAGGLDGLWAQVKSLSILGESPADPKAAVAWLHSLANADGGFGPRPGRTSDPVSTLRAIEALRLLQAPLPSTLPPAPPPEVLPEGLKPFTIQIQAPGQGSPEDAVTIAESLGIHLWGAKNSKPGWIRAAQDAARRRGVPVTFFVADEEYGTFVNVAGFGAYSHIADLVAPAGADFGASMSGKDPTWKDFCDQRIAPLLRAKGRMVWQICDNEELSCALLDDSLIHGGGYAMLSTFHMRQNFADILPYWWRYRHAIPFVALQDAHGREPWSWTDDLAGYRSVFLAKEPTWEGWLDALEHDRVVAMRCDETTKFRARMVGGSPATRARLSPTKQERPLVALAVVAPGDEFESARPEMGRAIRVRVGWSNNQQGLLLQPLAELTSLTLDGTTIEPRRVEIRDAKGGLADLSFVAELPAPAPGRHRAEATVRALGTGAAIRAAVDFVVP